MYGVIAIPVDEYTFDSFEYSILPVSYTHLFESLEEYKNNMLLVGINYDRKTKTHECKIEKLK